MRQSLVRDDPSPIGSGETFVHLKPTEVAVAGVCLPRTRLAARLIADDAARVTNPPAGRVQPTHVFRRLHPYRRLSFADVAYLCSHWGSEN
jgi:hypothetical protein